MMRLIGYGNPGRGDDGLGPAFAIACDVPGVTVSTEYQLTVDHALLIADADQVIFVDAMMDGSAPFTFARISPVETHDLTSHSLSPAAVLALSATLFGAKPKAFVLGITGYEFGEVKEGLSHKARDNLRLADVFFRGWVADQTMRGLVHA